MDGMGQIIFRPMGWDDSKSFLSHPIPWDANFFKNVPFMGWDGMVRDGIVPSHEEPCTQYGTVSLIT